MSVEQKVEDSLEILRAVGIPVDSFTARHRIRLALVFLATAGLEPNSEWVDASFYQSSASWAPTTREIISYLNQHYEQNISSGSYDDIRRRNLIYLVESGLVLRSANNPEANTNNPTRGYAINPDAGDVLRHFGRESWGEAVNEFRRKYGSLESRMERRREPPKVPVKLPQGVTVELSTGPHNQLQKAVVEEFLPRFAPNAELLYLGDTSKKSLHLNREKLEELGFFELAHDTLPDVVAYDPIRNWLFLIEAVHSSNPISKLRHLNLERLTKDCTAPRVYVSVFKDRQSFREWILEISWETEVWLVESPDHLIHFNGGKFLGPYEASRQSDDTSS